MLISAWDGADNGLTGGTGDITCARLDTAPLRIDPVTGMALLEDWNLVLVVPTQRQGTQDQPLCPAGWYRNTDSLIARRPDFRAAKPALASLAKYNTASDCLGRDPQAGQGENDVARTMNAADALAITHVKGRRRNWSILAWVAALALVSAAIYGDLADKIHFPAVLLGLYLVALLVLWAGVQWEMCQSELQEPWDWRLCTEMLRVLDAWRFVGYFEARPSMARVLGARVHVPVWIMQAYRGFALAGPAVADTPTALVALRQHWVSEQIKYFNKPIRTAEKRGKQRRLAQSSLLVSAFLAFTCLILEMIGSMWSGLTILWFLSGLLPGLGAVRLVYLQLHEKSGASAAAHRQRERFYSLRALLDTAPDIQAAYAQIAETGRHAIVETCVFHESAKLTQSQTEAFRG